MTSPNATLNAYQIKTSTEPEPTFTTYKVDKYMFLERLRGRLESDRTPYEPIFSDIESIIDPHLFQENMYAAGFPDWVTDLFITSTHLQSFDTLQAGLQENIFPSTQIWAKYGLMDELADDNKASEDPAVWLHLHHLTRKSQSILGASNFNVHSPIVLRSVSRYATGAIMMERHPVKTVRFSTFPVGSFWVSMNKDGVVDTFMYKFRWKVRQVVEEFCTKRVPGDNMKNASIPLRQQWDDPARHEEMMDVILIICPNQEYNPIRAKYDSKYERYSITYYEYGRSQGQTFLREEGTPYFPVYCPRWFHQPTDAYGVDCPGIKARSEIRRLFKTTQMLLMGLQKVIEPPMVVDPQVAGAVAGGMPGTTPNFATVVPGLSAKGQGFQPAYQIQLAIKEVAEYIAKTEQNIANLCYVQFFQTLASLEGASPRKATEILERVKESSRMLSPILGACDHDWIQPMMRDLYWIMVDDGIVQAAPKQMHGANMKVEVINRIAMALKQGDLNPVNAGLEAMKSIAEIKSQPGTEALNGDEVAQYVFRILNLPPDFLYSGPKLQKIRNVIAAQKQAQQKAQQMESMSKSARNLGGASTGGDTNLLQKMLQENQGGLSAT